MKTLRFQKRTLALFAFVLVLLGLLIVAGLRSGPFAPVAVTVAAVKRQTVSPALFGIGTVEAHYTYKIGPTFAGRILRLDVDVGDSVKANQVLGEMDPVDLDDKIRAQASQVRHAQASLREATARHVYARTQSRRYDQLVSLRATSEELALTKRHEWQVAAEAMAAAREELARARSDYEALMTQRKNLRLIAPVDGVVSLREADPGTTVVAGQAILEVIDPKHVWVSVRFDQINASGLMAGLPARIDLRSRKGQFLDGYIRRVELKADAITEELLARAVFDELPRPLPPVGELAEVTVFLPDIPSALTIPNAAIRRQGDRVGVWLVKDGDVRFAPVVTGASSLDGWIEVKDGLAEGDRLVVYSEKLLSASSRIREVDHADGGLP